MSKPEGLAETASAADQEDCYEICIDEQFVRIPERAIIAGVVRLESEVETDIALRDYAVSVQAFLQEMMEGDGGVLPQLVGLLRRRETENSLLCSEKTHPSSLADQRQRASE